MAKNYTITKEEGIKRICEAIREANAISDAIDDEHLATNSTFSSVKIDSLLSEIDTRVDKLENGSGSGSGSGGSIEVDNIDGIPVDLTGIYNNQVIGYDEEQGKLVPMAGTSRTEAILPSAESTAIWTFVSTENCTVNESHINVPYVNIPHDTESYKFKVRFNRAYLLSDFSNLAIEYGKADYCTCYVRLSKTADFSEIDAEFIYVKAGAVGNGNNNNISSLMGKFYIEVEVINTKPATTWNSIGKLTLS